MNNYSWIEKKLHKFALSYQIIREAAFDLESSLFSSNENNDNHVFVAGLARSGTTILLNALYESKEFSSLSYRDMPFIMAPNIWSKFPSNKKDTEFMERAHNDGIKVTVKSPEAFEEVFWMTFDERNETTQKKFQDYVQLVCYRYKKNRYLSKNNQNIRRLKLISKIFPNSKILIPFRNPINQSSSLLSMHKKFIQKSQADNFTSDYMKFIGHAEFGENYTPISCNVLKFEDPLDINHWLEQWCLTYKNCLELVKNNQNINLVCYEHLCSSKAYWLEILKMLGIKKNYGFSFNESQREIQEDTNNQITNEAMSLYDELVVTMDNEVSDKFYGGQTT